MKKYITLSLTLGLGLGLATTSSAVVAPGEVNISPLLGKITLIVDNSWNSTDICYVNTEENTFHGSIQYNPEKCSCPSHCFPHNQVTTVYITPAAPAMGMSNMAVLSAGTKEYSFNFVTGYPNTRCSDIGDYNTCVLEPGSMVVPLTYPMDWSGSKDKKFTITIKRNSNSR